MPVPTNIKEERIAAAAMRAIEEAEDRRLSKPAKTLPTELGGRDGPEPGRFGD
jgi:hypothetical protein